MTRLTNRKVLLVEPNYKNKYPPMGLMKLATYYRQSGDDVRFFKGDLRDLAADLVIEDLLEQLSSIDPDTKWKKYKLVLINYIRKANTSALDECEAFTSNAMAYQLAKDARLSYKRKDYFKNPPFDKVGITTLFTFYWDITIDARLITDANMKKLSEVNIYPLRVAFDHWEQKDIYERAIRTAVSNGITNLSNYMLYNFHDKPEHLYHRMKMNVDMCDELVANIYSFPMKYHPINDPEFFMNRDFIGKHWNRKFIRAIQAVLNSTKGKVGKGKTFFEEAFGADEQRFWTILWMPETFIIYRFMFKDNLAKEWEEKFWSLPADKLKTVQEIVALNQFKELDMSQYDEQVRDVLTYYQFTRDEAEELIKKNKQDND